MSASLGLCTSGNLEAKEISLLICSVILVYLGMAPRLAIFVLTDRTDCLTCTCAWDDNVNRCRAGDD